MGVVPRIHLGLQFGNLCVCYLVATAVVIFLEQEREQVFDGLSLRVSHRIHRGVGAFSYELHLQPVAFAVATDDAVDFPELQVVQNLVPVSANLAYEQLVDVVGGCQFFPFDPFSAFCSSPSGNLYHSANILVISTNASVSSSFVASNIRSLSVIGSSIPLLWA